MITLRCIHYLKRKQALEKEAPSMKIAIKKVRFLDHSTDRMNTFFMARNELSFDIFWISFFLLFDNFYAYKAKKNLKIKLN